MRRRNEAAPGATNAKGQHKLICSEPSIPRSRKVDSARGDSGVHEVRLSYVATSHGSAAEILAFVGKSSIRLVDADLAQRGLNRTACHLFLWFWRMKNDPEKMSLGIILKDKTIANELRCSVRTVQRAVSVLKNKGLLTVIVRMRPKDGGQTSNRYIPHWRPLSVPDPQPARVPMDWQQNTMKDAADDGGGALTPDTIFLWPGMSGGPASHCQGGFPDKAQPGQASEGDLADAIVSNPQAFAKSDQLTAGAPVCRFDDEDHVRLFLFRHLQNKGIVVRSHVV